MARSGGWTRLAVAAAAMIAAAACQRGDDGQRSGGATRPSDDAGFAARDVRGDVAGAETGPAEEGRQQRNAEIEAENVEDRPQGTSQATHVSGRVVSASDGEVVLKRDDGVEPDLKLQVHRDSSISIAGQPARPADLKEGTPVRASYRAVDGTLIRIDAPEAK
jgi:hypothetical protein